MINNSLTSQDYKTLGGSTTTGDFGSMMKEIFERNSEAPLRVGPLGHPWTPARPWSSAITWPQARSQWHLNYDRRLDIVPAYHGLVYVDRKTHEITRVTLEADNIPADFPVKMAQTVLDYRYEDISGHTFLLPRKARTDMAADDYLTRNDTEFRMYRKYQVESELKFDDATPPPLPEEKETPAAPAAPPPAKKTKK